MVTKLKGLRVDEGSLVDRGANPHALIHIFKRKEDVSKAAPEGSYEARSDALREAYAARFGGNLWICATFDDHMIIEHYQENGPALKYSVAYSEKEGGYELGERKEVEAVTEYVEKAMKTEAGEKFPASDYAYVPDDSKPSSWKLRLTSTPGGSPDAGIVGAAVAALGKGFRGNKVAIPADDLPAVKAKVKAAWKKANADKETDDMPDILKGGEGMDEGLDETEGALTKLTEGIAKAGKTLSAATVGRMKAVMGHMKAAMGAMEEMAGTMETEGDMKKGGNVALTQEVRDALPEDVRKHLEETEEEAAKVADLEAKVAELEKAEPEEEDIMKGLPDEVRERITKAESEAAEAKEVAKAEREARIAREFEEKAKAFSNVGSVEDVAKVLRKAHDADPETGAKLEEMLAAADARIALTGEIGKGEASEGTAEAELTKMAKAKAEEDGITVEKAMTEIRKTPTGRELINRYEAERGLN